LSLTQFWRKPGGIRRHRRSQFLHLLFRQKNHTAFPNNLIKNILRPVL
jgi:hypothetical protein